VCDYVELLSIDPLFEIVGPDRRRFRIPVSTEATGRVFAEIAPADAEGVETLL